jgi:N-acetylmuramoyl-L-alanine amidase
LKFTENIFSDKTFNPKRQTLPVVMKQTPILITIIAFLLLASFKPVPRRTFGVKTVVIDAGHGGHDVGCLGSSAKEKNIALNISLKLGEMIEKKFPDVRVIYTRKKDEFIELHERAGIANRTKADLFICIHCNSACVRNSNGKESCNESIHGIETFVMGLHKTDDNLAVSRRENSSILLEKDYKTKYDGFDPNSPEANIIFTLFQNAFMNQSISFASKIQNEIGEYAGRAGRGVKQAGFLVLYKTTMPSVLIETGFLTNPSEEKYLLSEKGQTDVAGSIFRAFKEYKIDMEGEITADSSEEQKPEQIGQPKEKQIPDPAKMDPVNETGNKKAEQGIAVVKDAEITDSAIYKPPVDVKPITDPKANMKAPVKTVDEINSDFFYTVQIGAAAPSATAGLEKYNSVEGIKKISGDDGIIRYNVGSFQNIDDAASLQTVMRNKGFKDAFVTAYYNGKKITLQLASKLLKKN